MTGTRIRVKIGAIEIEVEGTEEYVKSVVGEDIYETIDKLGEYKIVKPSATIVADEEDMLSSPASSGDIPSLAGVNGMADCLRTLLNSEWGKTPHTMQQIKEIFELNAKYFDDNPLSGTMTRLTKKGDIRRVGKKGEYRYLGK